MVEYDPFSAEVMQDPLPIYAELRRESPVHFVERFGAFALSRFAEEVLGTWPEYEVDLERAERLRTEFVQGYASLPIRY